jgi:hypothetical protein
LNTRNGRRAPRNGVVLAYWRVAGDGTSVPSPTIRPDAYVEIVFNLGGAVTLAGPAFNGSQPARTVVGLLDAAIEMRYPPDVCTFGIRLHPARAATLLGVPAREVVNAVRPLGQMSAALDERMSRALSRCTRESMQPKAARRSRLFSSSKFRRVPPTDDLMVRAVDQLLGADVGRRRKV